MRLYDIAEVARLSGTRASALRFYDEKGLIASVGRRGLRRLFEGEVFQRLALIGVGQAAGFSLDEIGAMFSADGKLQIDRQALDAKAEELDGRIRKLTAMRDGLRHAAVCPAENHLQCPSFQRILSVVGSRSRRRRAS